MGWSTKFTILSGFGAPLHHWLRYELRASVDDVLSESLLKKGGLFKPEVVNPVRYYSGASNLAGIILKPNPAPKQRAIISYGVNILRVLNGSIKLDATYTILSLLCIELWCQVFLSKL